MQKILICILGLTALLSAEVYQVGDIVTDFQFQDTNLDNGHLVVNERSVHALINQKKLLLINYFQPS